MSQIINFFPLSVFKEKIAIDKTHKELMINEILNMEKASKNIDEKKDTWTGDTKGYEFLSTNEKFNKLFKLIGDKVKDYISSLNINPDELNFYFQRSWATVTHNEGYIKPHRHDQSHISFAYYLSMPKGGGSIVFLSANPANEIAPGLFSSQLIKKPSLLNATEVTIEAKEDDIIIFPSKTRHSTKSNKTTQHRISISADIVIMLKNSKNFERLMPDLSKWDRF